MNNTALHRTNKMTVSFKGVKFGKSNGHPLKGSFVFKSNRHQNRIRVIKFSIVTPEDQKKNRNQNYNYFSIG